jgi:hypothetical protein
MAKCNIITYRLKRNVQSSTVLAALHGLLNKYSLSYRQLLWALSDFKKNTIERIIKDYPSICPCLEHHCENGKNPNCEPYRLSNYQEPGFTVMHPTQEDIIHEILHRVPAIYSLGSLEYYIDGISFTDIQNDIRENPHGFGPPIGSYVAYSREVHGDERHSYLILAVEYNAEKQPDLFRDFFLALSGILPGSYEGTQIIFE